MMKAEILAIVLIIIIGVMMTTAAHAQLRRKRMEMDEDSSEELVPQWRLNDMDEFPETCKNGQRQSPIAIDPESAVRRCYPPLEFSKYNVTYPTFMTNKAGQSLKLGLLAPVDEMPSIRGGGLKNGDNYTFAQVHFHWGNESMEDGSEHVIGSHQYPAEMHLVHFNTKYGSVSEAVNHYDGLAVLAVLIEIAPRGHVSFRRFLNFVEQIQEIDSKASLAKPFPLMDLLPDNTDSFYRYSGSLTTPGCQESVTWTVFDTPIAISSNQLIKFQYLMGENGEKLVNNNRPIQPLKDRIVYYRPGNVQTTNTLI